MARTDATDKTVKFSCVGRGSFLLWLRNDTLCTSGFVDYVTLSYNGPDGGMLIPLQARCCSDVRRLTPLLLGAGCVVSSLDDVWRRDWTSPSCKGCRGRSLRCGICLVACRFLRLLLTVAGVSLAAMLFGDIAIALASCRCERQCVANQQSRLDLNDSIPEQRTNGPSVVGRVAHLHFACVGTIRIPGAEGWGRRACNECYHFNMSMDLEIRRQQSCTLFTLRTNTTIQDVIRRLR